MTPSQRGPNTERMPEAERAPKLEWNAWGTKDSAAPLPEGVRALLESGLGLERRDTPSVDERDVRLPPTNLPTDARAALADVLGEENVCLDEGTRLRHAGGKSTVDLLRRRSGDAGGAPDAVVFPANHDEVLGVLRSCAEHRIAVITFGGGTSVVGGVEPERGPRTAAVSLDLRRLDSLVGLDPESSTATLRAGLRGPEAESLLAAHGFTLGHFPQSYEFATIGGFAASRSSGQASAGYGRFDDMVLGMRVATPRGTLDLGKAPASAAGPDLRELFLGSEGTLGVITEVTLRVHPVPEDKRYEAWVFPDFPSGAAALRRLAQIGSLPTVARLSDEVETGLNLALGAAEGHAGQADQPGGCLLITIYEGAAGLLAQRTDEAATVLHAAGGTSIGEEPARAWERGRFHAPYLRDALLDVGALAETLETAATWSNLDTTYAAVRDALAESLREQGTAPLVMCHISHVYPAGASLYYTIACAQGPDPVARWRAAKRAASEAIVTSGATITHHHAVGLDHRDRMVDEIGELGIDVLRAVKSTLDPDGVLNPGKLVPPRDTTARRE